jgi:ABC-type sugar transport system ATPase subunit
MQSAPASPPRVRLRQVEKSYPGVSALRGVDFDVRGGEIHALCGENGAGKSTLIGILGGVSRADAGEIQLDGRVVRFRDPADALAQGVAVIHQEFSQVGTMTVAENLALGDEPRFGPWIHRREIRRRAQQRLSALGFRIDANRRADSLTTGQRQLVEIAKALGWNARVLVLDEPTAALSRPESERLFQVLGELKVNGLAIIYISHHLEEIARIADRVTVLRDGARVGTWPASEMPPNRLTAAMVGEVVDRRLGAPKCVAGAPLLVVEQAVGATLKGIDLVVRSGEVVGLTGIAGSGHEEFAEAIFGAVVLRSGRMMLHGRPYRPSHPADARAAGVASVPADRRREGLIPTWGVVENLTLAILDGFARIGFLARWARDRKAETLRKAFNISCSGLTQKATTLSGGNQQKVLIARWVATKPRLLIMNDPTRGIDVRTREAIHRRIEDLSQAGMGVVLATADIHELFRLTDRIVVFRGGVVIRDIRTASATEQDVLASE